MGCDEKIYENPLDPDADPDSWSPSNLLANIINASEIQLTWQQDNSQITGFNIYRKDSTAVSYSKLGTADTTFYSDTSITLGNEYTYRISAYNSTNTSSHTESNSLEFWKDCAGIWGSAGTAIEDDCDKCTGGTTGLTFNYLQDDCGICSGDDTGHIANSDKDCAGVCFGPDIYFNDVCYLYDIDGNIYEPVQMGEQLWMAENLKVTHFNNGDSLNFIEDPGYWLNMPMTSAYAYTEYDNQTDNGNIYGYLYEKSVIVDERGICPIGWHVPSNDEWIVLEMFLGMSLEDADVSYAQGSSHGSIFSIYQAERGVNEGSQLADRSDLWVNIAEASETFNCNDADCNALEGNDAFGTSGFLALPGGYIDCRENDYCSYKGLGHQSYFWGYNNGDHGDFIYDSSSPSSISGYLPMRKLDIRTSTITSYSVINNNHQGTSESERHGFSIRCIKD